MPIYSPTGFLDVTNATLRGSKIVTTSNVGVANVNPLNTLSVGSNLQVEDTGSNVLTIRGNAAAAAMTLGVITVAPSYSLEVVSNIGNTVSNTIQFTNETTGFVSDSNIEVGTGNLFVNTSTGLVSVGNALSVSGRADITDLHTSNLTVDGALYANASTGRVGINTTSPGDFNLDVHGSANVGALTATDVIVTGNLAVAGELTSIRSTTVNVDDPIIGLANNNTSDPAVLDIGFVMARPSTATGSNVAIIFDESSDTLEIGYTTGKHTDTTITIDDSTLFHTNIHGNVAVSNLEIGQFSVVAAYGLDHVTNENNSTGDTIISTNGTTGLQTTANVSVGRDALVSGNVEVSKELTVSGNVEVSKELTVTGNVEVGTANLFVNTLTGKVGVGTDNPLGKAHIYVDDAASGTQLFIENASTSNRTGLVLRNGDGEDFRIQHTSGSSNAAIIQNNSTVNGGIKFYAKGDGEYEFRNTDSNTLRMVIENDGNVGIGTNNPTSKLYIQDDNADTKITIRGGGSTVNDSNVTIQLLETASSFYGGAIQYSGISAIQGLRFGHYVASSTPRIDMAIDRGTGNVGIGTTNPLTKLHVNGTDGTTESGNMNYFSYANGSTLSEINGETWGNNGISIWASDSIVTKTWIVSHSGNIAASDTRIKKNITDADDAECLEVLRLLKPKKYQYKDEIERGTEPVWGFIAQEVRETLPYATQLRKDVLPNIYELANVSQSNVITFTNFNTSNLESNATTLIRTTDNNGEDHDVHLAEVIDEHTIRVEEDLTEWIGSVDETGNVVAGNQLFIYGQEVDDFVFLKKEAIWTVATSALQEVDRQLQAEKAKVATLETQLASVLARLDALENP